MEIFDPEGRANLDFCKLKWYLSKNLILSSLSFQISPWKRTQSFKSRSAWQTWKKTTFVYRNFVLKKWLVVITNTGKSCTETEDILLIMLHLSNYLHRIDCAKVLFFHLQIAACHSVQSISWYKWRMCTILTILPCCKQYQERKLQEQKEQEKIADEENNRVFSLRPVSMKHAGKLEEKTWEKIRKLLTWGNIYLHVQLI